MVDRNTNIQRHKYFKICKDTSSKRFEYSQMQTFKYLSVCMWIFRDLGMQIFGYKGRNKSFFFYDKMVEERRTIEKEAKNVHKVRTRIKSVYKLSTLTS